MKVRCIKDFKKQISILDITFHKDKEYVVNEVNGKLLLDIGIGNINFKKIKDNFEVIE